MVDTDVNNDDEWQYFETPIKTATVELNFCDKNTTTTQVRIKIHPHQCQQSSSTKTTSLELPPFRK